MRKNFSTPAVLVIITICLLAGSCSHDGGISYVTIDLGLEENTTTSILEKFRNLFVTRLYAQPPVNLTEITVNVTAPDMDTVTGTYPASTTSISIEVPSGSQRTFEVLAQTPSATLRGATTITIAPGEVTVSINMDVHNTKILIPDPQNVRIVQIDDMTGAGWTTLNGSDISFAISNTLTPYDIDFDSLGRIYIANFSGTSGEDCVVRIDDITSTTYTHINSLSSSGILSVAIDRPNRLVYYANSDTIFRCGYNDTAPVDTYAMSSFFSNPTIYGISIGSSGIVYIAIRYGTLTATYAICKFDPDADGGNGLVISSYTGVPNVPWDVMVKDGSCYFANYHESSVGSNNRVIQLTADTLSFVKEYGTGTNATPTAPNELVGPRRFVAVLNDDFYLIDEQGGGGGYERLLSFSDLNGSNWKDYGSYGSGTGYFDFFYSC